LSSFTAAALAATAPASALDKQGSAHGGQVGGGAKEVNISGSAMLGASIYNPTYAARPDNSGHALFRYALHFDFDLLGRYLSIPIDVNVFTDRERRKAAVFAPSELDLIAGLTSTNSLAKGLDLEAGVRVENDRPVDRGNYQQTYVDARARLLYSAAAVSPTLAERLKDGDLAGYLTLGWFMFNKTYAARPDNTGLALLRYAAHGELSLWHRRLAVGADSTFFTDRRASNVVRPSELDLTGELIGRRDPFELHLAYERDMPIDQGGRVQSLLYAVVAYGFDFHDRLHPSPHQ
ncbi:MAG TPA: hypothetical protein VEQ59_00140, partial [Polyangiaceae bacterium]|nr:hypothetical protein [Polyangiaceae bacterium]